MVDKKVLVQFMDKRIETLQKLISLDGYNSNQRYQFIGQKVELEDWKNDLLEGKFDVKLMENYEWLNTTKRQSQKEISSLC